MAAAGRVHIDYTVSQSDWIAILEQVGYARRYLVELEVPSPQANPKLAEAIVYFVQARRRYMEGEWRHCVESLRQCVAAIVGKKPLGLTHEHSCVARVLRVGVQIGTRTPIGRTHARFAAFVFKDH